VRRDNKQKAHKHIQQWAKGSLRKQCFCIETVYLKINISGKYSTKLITKLMQLRPITEIAVLVIYSISDEIQFIMPFK